MKLGDVLKKERELKGLSLEDMASKLSLSNEEYGEIEGGETLAEKWGPALAQLAIKLETPTARLLAESGRSADTKDGQAGSLIKGHRERREQSEADLADYAGLSADEYASVEAGSSPIEKYGPLLLNFAEVLDMPVFNLFYPCGLPFQELDDYP